MTFFSPQKKEGSSTLIFLSSGQIEAEIFSSTQKKTKNNFYIKENFKFIQEINTERLEKETSLALKKILEKLFDENSRKKDNEKIGKIFFIFGSPWYIS
ncbi:MAG: hypothetical protein WCO18_01865, partial [bacterium]